MKKHFNKGLMTNKDNKNFKNSIKCWTCDNDCHIAAKYRESTHRDCSSNLKLNQKISFAFRNLNKYDFHFIMRELGKFNLKINFIPNGLEKHMNFTINNKFSFIDSFQFLSSSLDSLVKNLGKDDFKYLIQEFDNNVLDLVLHKGFYPYEYISDFERFKEQLTSKEKFYSSLTGKNISDKENALNVWNKFERKTTKDHHDLYLKCEVLLLADMFEKFRNSSLKNYGLCTSYCLSAPGLSWDAMIKMEKIELELIRALDMFVFFQKGIRG